MDSLLSHPASHEQDLPDLAGKSQLFQSLLHGFGMRLLTLTWSRTWDYTTSLEKTMKHSISMIKINFQDASWKYAYILKSNHTKESKQSKRLCWFMIPISVQRGLRPMTWALSALNFKVCQQARVRQNFLCVQRENLQAELREGLRCNFMSLPRAFRDLSPLTRLCARC